MLLKQISINPKSTFNYLERYVNIGSPSGFSFKYSSSLKYSPTEGVDKFHIPVFWSKEVQTYGNIPTNVKDYFIDNNKKGIPFHPDNIMEFKTHIKSIRDSVFQFSPTASPRTLLSDNLSPFYVKLHYKGVLGRIERSLPIRKSLAEVEISNLFIEEVLPLNKINLGIYYSPFCNYYKNEQGIDFSFIYRKYEPIPILEAYTFRIPCFSLFSKDSKQLNHDLLLVQLINKSNIDLYDFLNNYIFSVIRLYIGLCRDHGLLPEIHAQNLVFEFDNNFNCIRPILRDFMEVEKDLTIREAKGLSNNFDSIDYKTLSINKDDYYIRHSFSFDFKLSYYVILPLLETYASNYSYELDDLIKLVKEFVLKEWGNTIYNHFKPFSVWYSVANNLLVKKSDRVIVKNTNPLFR